MDPRDKEIAFLEAELAECRSRLQQESLAIGVAATADSAPATIPADAELARQLEDLKKLRAHAGQARDLIQQVKTRCERIGAIETLVKANDDKVREAMREVEHRYREIGEVAGRVYKEQCAQPETFRDVFLPLVTLEQELDELRGEIERKRQEGAKLGFFAKMMDKSKILLAEGKLRYREMDRASTCEEVGRRVCASAFPESVKDPVFAELMAKVEVHRRKAIEVQEETAGVRAEQARLEGELRAFGVVAEPTRRVQELESEIADTERRLREGQIAAGQRLVDAGLVEAVAPEAALRARTVLEIRALNQAKQERIERIRAAKDLDKLGDDLTRIYGEKAKAELQLKETQEKLAALDAELARHSRRAEDLRQRAGNEAGGSTGPTAAAPSGST